MSAFGPLGTVLIYIVPFLFILTVVVFFHELGHFLVGRWCGVKVEVFSLGFGPELIAFTDRHGTRWRLAAIPLGGYVKFHGDANGAGVPDASALSNMPESERALSFAGQSVAKRAAIVAAGPLANFLLAIAIFTAIFYTYGHSVLLPRVENVVAASSAEKAGIKAGDFIIAIDGRQIESFVDMQRIVSSAVDV